MSKKSNYEFQLSQVELALETQPGNQDLINLRNDLQQLIRLESGPAQSSTDHSIPTNSSLQFNLGDVVSAKWSDGKFYPARIEAIDKTSRTYTVLFLSYGNIERVDANDVKKSEVKPQPASTSAPVQVIQKKRKSAIEDAVAIHSSKTSNTSSSGTFADTQKKKKQTLKEHVAKREAEQQGKQNAWQSFNNKAAKKKVIGKFPVSINKKSIFATVDDPFGKIGVTNSGRPMTTFGMRGKHLYEAPKEEVNQDE